MKNIRFMFAQKLNNLLTVLNDPHLYIILISHFSTKGVLTLKLFQVRKGQFVYYKNELHRVYTVKPVYKKSVHLVRLRDLTQHLCSAAEVDRYQPKEGDSFIFNHNVFTLNKDRKAQEGDYILITNPDPDYLDHYSLNEIEVVDTVENKGVITNNSNGIRHHEYLLMVPGRTENSNPIEFRDVNHSEENNVNESVPSFDIFLPSIGDVYKKKMKPLPLNQWLSPLKETLFFRRWP